MKDPNKKYDLSKWKYAELRDTINTSCGMYNVDSLNSHFITNVYTGYKLSEWLVITMKTINYRNCYFK